ncbi:uncharacterized protein LOC129256263 [Lytechinus pictus]|uniref:uncharacterized protein LOC129256263 n=1 Tax=Lytechinus pictus TaxID=7653 RepID=UPI0030B9F01D
MASDFSGPFEQDRLNRERRHATWSCAKHNTPIKFYCEHHVIAICNICVTENHITCNNENIEDLIREMKTETDTGQRNEYLLHVQEGIKSCKRVAAFDLTLVQTAVQNAYDTKIENEKTIKREKEREINAEADEQICRINEEREAKIRFCYKYADKQIEPLEQQKNEILKEISLLKEKIENLEMDFKRKLTIIHEKIKELKQDDCDLMKNTYRILELIRSLRDEEGCQAVRKLEHILRNVRFVKGYINSSFCGRLECSNYMQWKHIKTIDVQGIENPVKVPKFVGLVGYDSIAVTNHEQTDLGLYVINLSQGTSIRAVEGSPDTYFVACSSIDRSRVACGKFSKRCTGDILDKCVTVHDDNWNLIRNIPIPRKVDYNYAYVDVGSDGKILAAIYGQSSIHIINPDNGEIEDTINFSGKEIRGRIHALSSGSIIARSGECEVTVITRNGETKSHVYDEGDFSLFRSETLTDTIFVTNWNKTSGRCTVGQMSSDGEIKVKGEVGFNDPSTSFYRSACLVTPSGKLVLCDEKQIFVYKKQFVL